MTGSARSRVLVPFDFSTTLLRGYYAHSGYNARRHDLTIIYSAEG